MCFANNEGFITSEGMPIKIGNLENIPEKVKKELEKSAATQLDILYIRNSLHIQKTQFSTLTKTILRIQNSLEIDCGNDNNKVRPIKEVVTEMYQREGGRRDLFKVRGVFNRHRRGIFIGVIIFFLSGILFHDQLHTIFSWLSEHLELVIKAIL